ncbi:carbohydrate ABC transporter membrane protein 2 (CUT1 family) [Frondihabitans sp. PhB188]|uniref:carbohydrate ABC transporter permease n=1 Tax=Frondihabitans sp. PhB188 TaxID=2485200 RepID=UPI000F4752AB|nr:carbohydrate ABC transporter permease [Frondihabitans sp. PhB188]ROQ38772.1 carbohydrate ABC transporter membrane protein 2 (CUT1 family) [Frondihabitans sp. PhB188]
MSVAVDRPRSTTRDRSRDNDVVAVRVRKHRGPRARTLIQAAIITIWCLLPFYWMIVTAFRDVGYTFDTNPLPSHVTLDNFKTAFSTELGNHLGRALLNSLFIGVCVTAIALLVGISAAYALARLDFKGKSFIAGGILAASMFPGVALISPLFQLFTDIHWFGSYQALILPSISFVLPLTVYTLTSFFREMPWDLEEAARIDGCTRIQAFRRIILPLAAPAVFTTAILAFISSWNEYLISNQLSSAATQPVTVAIAQFAGSQPHQEPYTAVMAAGTIVTIPLVILVLVFQRRIVAGLTAGGVKG